MANKILVAAAIFAGLALSSSVANGATVGPVYPPPGGVTFAPSGLGPGETGGRTYTFTLFNPTAYDQLWWGPAAVGSAMDGSIDEAGETMSFLNSVGQAAYWTGQTDVTLLGGGVQTIYTKFTATIVSGATGWLAPGGVGITPGPLQVTEVTGDPFVVNMLFEASSSLLGIYNPFNNVYDSLPRQQSGLARTSFAGQFFYTEPQLEIGPVPIPAALPLFAAALGAMGFFGRRRKLKAALTI